MKLNKLVFSIVCLGGGICLNNPAYSLYSCKSCPSGKICVSGQVKEKSACTRSQVRKISPGSGEYTLEPGVYDIEYASGGGGGGGSYGGYDWGCYWHSGGKGGNGDKATSQIFHIANASVLKYTVGSGGTKGPDRSDGGNGGDTTWTLQGSSFTAHGGKGGGGASKHDGGVDRENSGSGAGGAGGEGGPRKKCYSVNGSPGGDGWIIVYKYSC